VTSTQRARLVVALGVLNLVLATFGLAVGIGSPRQPTGEFAAVSPSPVEVPGSVEPGATPSGGVSTPGPSEGPTASSTPASPSTEPSPSPTPTGIVVAQRPSNPPASDRPVAAPTTAPTQPPTAPKPTPVPTPRPTVQPTPRPTPTPEPAKSRTRPPCPGAVSGPPGHHKDISGVRPCGKGAGPKNGTSGGFVIVFPLALTAVAGSLRRRSAVRSLRRDRRPQ
jgi:hypothetical protein